MNARALARFTAVCRVGIGSAFVAHPRLFMRPWIGRDADSTGAVLLARALGARDLVIGAGTLAAVGERDAGRRWLAAAMVADGTDLAVTLAARGELPPRGRALVVAIAGTAVGLGAVALATLDEE
jgi:hypothetical protein